MSYQVLARKWRPTQFSEVIGQPHIVEALSHGLEKQRLHHAYLFTGTRGVGKTSLARLFAKALNCENGISVTPCEKCSSCEEISQGRFVDLIEVDAASRTKVEDTRELLDNVQYAPTRGRYKVYLIDEVHMLSGHSFNALLKTLEEPPPHVIFLLATTDPHKLPITVLSRCLQFHLKNIPDAVICKHLTHILSQENIFFEQEALPYIAQAAKGSMRDALSLLDQAIAHGQGSVITEKVLSMLGCIDQSHTIDLIRAIAQNNGRQVLDICQTIAELAADYQQVLAEMLHVLTEVALLQTVPDAQLKDETQREPITALTQLMTKNNVQLYYQIALIGHKDIAYAPSLQTGFTMLMLRMLNFTPQLQTIPPKNMVTEHSSSSTSKPETSQTASQTNTAKSAPKQQETKQPEQKSPPKPVNTLKSLSNWENLLKDINLLGPLKILANHCMAKKLTDTEIHLVLDSSQAPLLTERNKERLKEALMAYLNTEISMIIEVAAGEVDSPAALLQKQKKLKNAQAKENIEKDRNVQAILKEFNATINPSSIKTKE